MESALDDVAKTNHGFLVNVDLIPRNFYPLANAVASELKTQPNMGSFAITRFLSEVVILTLAVPIPGLATGRGKVPIS